MMAYGARAETISHFRPRLEASLLSFSSSNGFLLRRGVGVKLGFLYSFKGCGDSWAS